MFPFCGEFGNLTTPYFEDHTGHRRKRQKHNLLKMFTNLKRWFFLRFKVQPGAEVFYSKDKYRISDGNSFGRKQKNVCFLLCFINRLYKRLYVCRIKPSSVELKGSTRSQRSIYTYCRQSWIKYREAVLPDLRAAIRAHRTSHHRAFESGVCDMVTKIRRQCYVGCSLEISSAVSLSYPLSAQRVPLCFLLPLILSAL